MKIIFPAFLLAACSQQVADQTDHAGEQEQISTDHPVVERGPHQRAYEKCAFTEAVKYGEPPQLGPEQAQAVLRVCRPLLRAAAVESLKLIFGRQTPVLDEAQILAVVAREEGLTARKLSKAMPIV